VAVVFICPYSTNEIVLRAKSWVGKPVTRTEWRQGVTCIHLAAFSYGWDGKIPDNWLDWKISELSDLLGWDFLERPPVCGDLGIFEIRGREHIGIFTSKNTFIHAGSIMFTEAKADRFMRYFKGVLTCQ
jgi:hypothetical protein